jgi:hypothetical protein
VLVPSDNIAKRIFRPCACHRIIFQPCAVSRRGAGSELDVLTLFLGLLQPTQGSAESVPGQSRRFNRTAITSDLLRLADILNGRRHVSIVPRADLIAG